MPGLVQMCIRDSNYELPDGSITAPTIKMPVLGVHCEAIMESRHLDVIEMDAASHNGCLLYTSRCV